MVAGGAGAGVDSVRAMKMALVHDVAEAIVGDITPHCKVRPGACARCVCRAWRQEVGSSQEQGGAFKTCACRT